MNAAVHRLTTLAILPVLLAGCRTQGETSGDMLRKQNLELQNQVAQLEKDASELRAKLSELVGGAGSATKSPEVAEATPRVAAIEIDFLSGPTVDSSAPPQSDRSRTVAVYIKPLDGRGRFVQATGKLTVEVSRLASLTPPASTSASPDAPARQLASKSLEPLQLRDAYRSGFTGTYYVVELPIPATDLQPPGQILLRAHFSDAITGASFEASRIVGLR
ncbi:MAG: hypothetical protein ACREJD_03235 [Phycisphaerales bacterium]